MKKNMKKAIGNMVIHVGKSFGVGMYNPKIPEMLKEAKVIQRGSG